MSGTYQEIDLDALGAADKEPEIVLVEEQQEAEPEIVVEPEESATPAKPATAPAAEDDDDGADGGEATEQTSTKRPLTRTQRLRAARDHWKADALAKEERLKQAEARLATLEGDAIEGAAVSMDLYIRSLDDQMKALRVDYDKAFDAGDRDALFKVTQQIAEVQAEKKTAERERRSIPTKAAPTSGGEGSQQTQPTTATTPQPSSPNSGKPTPEAAAWHKENPWFGKDRTLTMVAIGVDQEMVEDGYDARQPGYYEELDRRIRAAMPHKFQDGGTVTAKPKPQSTPTIQSRGPAAPASNGKITVRVTAADRQMAAHLGLDIKDYMAAKVRREQLSEKNPSGYTEIV